MLSAPGDQEGFCWMPSSRTNTVNRVKLSDIKVQDTFISFCPNKWIGVLFVTAQVMTSVLLWAPFSRRVKVDRVGWWGGVGLKPAPPAVVMLICLGGWAVIHLVASLQTSYWVGYWQLGWSWGIGAPQVPATAAATEGSPSMPASGSRTRITTTPSTKGRRNQGFSCYGWPLPHCLFSPKKRERETSVFAEAVQRNSKAARAQSFNV